MGDLYNVGIAEMKVSKNPSDVIMALGLGSCVAISLFDESIGVGGVLHIMLPSMAEFSNRGSALKFADSGIPLLIEAIQSQGSDKASLVAKVAGGATMFPSGRDALCAKDDIGFRNVNTTRKILAEAGIPITGENSGGHRGRTMRLEIAKGRTTVRSIGEDEREI
jgi:chemotaxis protein CheD